MLKELWRYSRKTMDVEKSPEMFKGVQGCSRESRNVLGSLGMFKGVQGFSEGQWMF
jgi:hypothetical protein